MADPADTADDTGCSRARLQPRAWSPGTAAPHRRYSAAERSQKGGRQDGSGNETQQNGCGAVPSTHKGRADGRGTANDFFRIRTHPRHLILDCVLGEISGDTNEYIWLAQRGKRTMRISKPPGFVLSGSWSRERRLTARGCSLGPQGQISEMDRKSRNYSEKSARERSYGAVPHSSAWVLTSLSARERAGDFIFNDATLNQVEGLRRCQALT